MQLEGVTIWLSAKEGGKGGKGTCSRQEHHGYHDVQSIEGRIVNEGDVYRKAGQSCLEKRTRPEDETYLLNEVAVVFVVVHVVVCGVVRDD